VDTSSSTAAAVATTTTTTTTTDEDDVLLLQQQQQQQQQQQAQDVLAAASSASLATAAAAAACVNHHSVVPDLMRVYESMTQSSNSKNNSPTKNTNSNNNNNNNNSHHHHLSAMNDLNALSQPASYADYLGQSQQHNPLSASMMHPPSAHSYYDPNDPHHNTTTTTTTMYYNPSTATVASNLWRNYDTSGLSLAIPPPYASPSQQQAPSVFATTGSTIPGDHNTIINNSNNNNVIDPSDARNTSDNNNNVASGGNGGRPVRAKRNAAMAALDHDPTTTGVGYESSVDGGGSSGGRGGGGGGGGPNPKTRRKSNKGGGGGRNHHSHNNARISSNAGGGGDGKGPTGGNHDDKNDGRWSKRFTWPDDLHRDFVSAIFDVGLKHSSPSTVMEHMPPHEQITTERIKSHLQKYRLHRQKAKKEFMTSYQQTMEQIHADGGVHNMTSLSSGQVAAHLSYVSEHHPDPETEGADDTEGGGQNTSTELTTTHEGEQKFQEETSKNDSSQVPQQAPAIVEEPTQDVFYLPKLTEAEKFAPIGISLGYLMGLFFTLRQQLEIQRQEQQKQQQLEGPMHVLPSQQQQQDGHHDPNQQQLFDEFATEQAAGRKMSVGVLQTTSSIPSSSRSNLEVNSLIKREMQSQMAFQNKMRALKQQELNKYSKTSMDTTMNNTAGTDMGYDPNTSSVTSDTPSSLHPTSQIRRNTNKKQQSSSSSHPEYQGAGETGGADTAAATTGHREGVSLGEEDDFWNTSVVDDELFDFLMNS
jgi:SHAQKYF class myb-like DNA-binding protein